MSNFLHDIIKAWFVCYPEKVQRVIKENGKTWAWLNGYNIHSREEVYGHTYRKYKNEKYNTVFFDVVYKLKVPFRLNPEENHDNTIFLEIKTGKFNDDWIFQMQKQWEGKYNAKISSNITANNEMLIWIVKQSEINIFEEKVVECNCIQNWHRWIFSIPLEWFIPSIIQDLSLELSLLQEARA